MKNLKSYENFLTNLFKKNKDYDLKKLKKINQKYLITPNLTDKQYWIRYIDVIGELPYNVFIVLKFTHENNVIVNTSNGGEYCFDSILGKDIHFENKKMGDDFGQKKLYKGEIPFMIEDGILRLATSQEIKKYSRYFVTNKYNL